MFTWITLDYNQILLLIVIFLSVQWNGVNKDEIRDREANTSNAETTPLQQALSQTIHTPTHRDTTQTHAPLVSEYLLL